MTLGTRLKEFRTVQHLSQKDVADFLNISRQSISRWETDKSYPDIDNLIKISRLYKVSVDEMLVEAELNGKSNTDKNSIKLTTKHIDESWVLTLLTVLSIAIAPFGLISIPLILWRNKKNNQFYKLILLSAIIIFIYNLYVLQLGITSSLDIGTTITIE